MNNTPIPGPLQSEKKTGLRVLSLFDGISTGKSEIVVVCITFLWNR
jgi:hypothetical protein